MQLVPLLLAVSLAPEVSAGLRDRTLASASRKEDLQARSTTIQLRNEAELVYVEKSNVEGEPIFGATVQVTSSKPVLILEDVDYLLDDISCEPDSILLSFASFVAHGTSTRLEDLLGGHIITSHIGCNEHDERLAYRVLSVEQTSQASCTLGVTLADWRTSFDSVSVKMNTTTTSHELRSHQEARRLLRKRQQDLGASLSDITPTLTPATPASIPSTAPTSASVGFSDSERLVNQKLPLPSEIPITLTCNLCEVHGTIDIAWSEWEVNATNGLSGYAAITSYNLGAWIDLASNVSQAATFSIGILNDKLQSQSVRVPGLGAASVQLGPFLAGGYSVNTGFALTSYGVGVQVPDGSTIAFGVKTGNKPDASQVGFSNAVTNILPWNAELRIPEIDLWLAVRWTVAVSFRFLPDEISGSGGATDLINNFNANPNAAAYADTPIFNATVTANVDNSCKPGSGTTDNISVKLQESYGVGAYINGEILGRNINKAVYKYVRAGLNLVASDSSFCLSYDEGGRRYRLAGASASRGFVLELTRRITLTALILAGIVFALL